VYLQEREIRERWKRNKIFLQFGREKKCGEGNIIGWDPTKQALFILGETSLKEEGKTCCCPLFPSLIPFLAAIILYRFAML
jgi:hypothetical protein